jgi:hypothetical protein
MMQDARWWNRRRCGAMASALLTYSEELEKDADWAGRLLYLCSR